MFLLKMFQLRFKHNYFLVFGMVLSLGLFNVFTPLAQAKFVYCSESEWSQQALLWLVKKIGYYPLFYFCYEINAGATENVTITFDERDVNTALNHYVMVDCDDDCTNIDLKVYDHNNQLIGEDLNPNDSFAKVRIDNIRDGKEIQVKMIMQNCQTDYCGAVLATTPIQ
jgi:hypothetical protein